MSKIPLPILLATGVLGGGSLPAPTFDLTATTTAPAETVTLRQITPAGQDVEIDWGDGTVETIADGSTAARSHQYVAAGAYTISLPYVEYAAIDIRDGKVGGTVDADNPFPQVTGSLLLEKLNSLTWTVGTGSPFPPVTDFVDIWGVALTWTVSADNPFPPVTDYIRLLEVSGLTWTVSSTTPFPSVTNSVWLQSLPGLTWTVSSTTPFPSVTDSVVLRDLPGLTWTVSSTTPFPSVTGYVILYDLSNLTWTVSSTTPFPSVTYLVRLEILPNLTWVVSAAAPFPSVTYLVRLTDLPNLTWNSGAAANLHSVGEIIYENNLLTGEVDTVLADLYSVFPQRTKVGTIDLLGGGNAAPTGVSPGSAECPPTSGWNTAYELVNDTCGIANFHWTSVSLQV